MRSLSAFIDSSGSKYAGSGSYSTSISSMRVLRNLFADRGNTGHVIADVADLLHRQRGLVVTHGKNAVGIGRVRAGDDGDDALKRLGARGIDALDASVRIGRMQNLADQHPGEAEVVGVLACAGGLAGGVHHGDRFADYRKISHKISI